ncbi:MAG: hypothetical protein LQ343_000405 [Gyalolechia ehrenbergii]|nr:MAG: hypothetical protein LQ343_000405 [Gyalolechia ehrenbergii]
MLLYPSTILLFLSIRAARSDTEPPPIVVNPSGNFRGIDGNWSTFTIGVGTPPQLLELLPSTKVPETWVVLNEGCTGDDPKNCSDTRGGVFNYDQSSTWSLKDTYALASEANLGYTTNSDNGAYGWENLTLTSTDGIDATASHVVIAGIATKDFYLGSLGLAGRAITWEDSSSSLPSLMTSLKEQGKIQSQSYGYTAGASYSERLTLGGYDASRSMPNGVSFNFSSQLERQLTVAIQGMSVSNSMAESQVLTSAIYALVDSTVPHLWLPLSVCYAFEHAFGIEFDPITSLYLVNETQHQALMKQNAELTISLAVNTDGGSVIDIKLPYASLDLEATPPLVKSQSRYFPLRRAKDETQFTLGRVLLQEAFIFVDYDQKSFSISEAQYTEGTPSNIVATTSMNGTDTTDTSSNTTNTADDPSLVKSTSPSSSTGIGTGAIAGIVAGVIVLVVVAAGFCFWKFKYRKSKTEKDLKGKAELEDNVEPKGIHEAYGKRRLSDGSERRTKNGASINVDEIVQTPPAEAAELEGTRPSRAQTRLDQPSRAELPSPDPFRPELESPGLGIIRSELSTPEPPSELSTRDPSLVPELTSQDMPHELSGSNRNSRIRPLSYRNNLPDSDIISPQDSASIRPALHGRKGSDDTIPTPISPQPQRPSLRQNQRRHSGLQRSHHGRLHSQSSHDTFETRFNGNCSPAQPHRQGSPSPLASPPLGSQPSPVLSALNSPTFPHQQMGCTGPPTPGFDINENEPLMSSQQQQTFRGTRFSENLTSDPETMAREERPGSLDDARTMVKEKVEKLENPKKDEH